MADGSEDRARREVVQELRSPLTVVIARVQLVR